MGYDFIQFPIPNYSLFSAEFFNSLIIIISFKILIFDTRCGVAVARQSTGKDVSGHYFFLFFSPFFFRCDLSS